MRYTYYKIKPIFTRYVGVLELFRKRGAEWECWAIRLDGIAGWCFCMPKKLEWLNKLTEKEAFLEML